MGAMADDTSSYLKKLSDIQPQFLLQRQQAVCFAEQMIESGDLAYIPQIFSCFPLGNFRLPMLDADMRRLEMVCEIVAAEEKVFGECMFLDHVSAFHELIGKYIRITLFLRRLEVCLPDEALEETVSVLVREKISVCAVRKITGCEIFVDPEFVYNRALQIIYG